MTSTPKSLKEDLFYMIEQVMEKDQITQAEIARRIGAMRINVNKVMRRNASVSVEFLMKMAESIGIEIEIRMDSKNSG